MFSPPRPVWSSFTVIGTLVLASACVAGPGPGGSGGGVTPGPTSTTAAPAPTSASPTAPGGGVGPGPGPGAGGDWTSDPVTVTREITVPPVPMLIGIRSAAHPDQGFDRIVLDFAGPLPGYTVRYVDEVREDGSGRLVTMPGRRYLLVVLNPAQAHTDAGTALVSPTRRLLGYPMLRGYVLVGDFEGYVSVALGLDDVVGFRIGELPGTPGRIYLDVAA
jgi:hypothetical protein